MRPGATYPMRQFSTILVVIYLILGIGTGAVYYAKVAKHAAPQNDGNQLALEASMVALAWPFHILGILAGHDPR